MISITTVRNGLLHVVAYTINDRNEIFVAAAFTRRGAEEKLLKTVEKHNKENA